MARSYSTRYKEAFKDTWDDSAKKEAFVKECIERFTGQNVTESGFGAGHTGYIEGASGEHGYERAAPDLTIDGTNVCIEVSGPLRPIANGSDLLINVSKTLYALEHPELEYWFAWVNGVTQNRNGVKMIRLGQQFRQGQERGEINHTQFRSRGVEQFFVSVPADHYTVCSFDTFLAYLKQRETLQVK